MAIIIAAVCFICVCGVISIDAYAGWAAMLIFIATCAFMALG